MDDAQPGEGRRDGLEHVMEPLTEAIIALEMEEVDLPHIVVVQHHLLGSCEYLGPYPTALKALSAAGVKDLELQSEFTDRHYLVTVAALVAPGGSETAPTWAPDPAGDER